MPTTDIMAFAITMIGCVILVVACVRSKPHR
jgi:hypothetical protein